jgi:N-carbamoyl-L-amino-acid hydrolase
MQSQGIDAAAAARITLPAPARFLEFHIEQGPVLATAGEPYALINSIRGGLRYRDAQIHGTWAHSGGAPREIRADVVFSFADLVTALDENWAARLGKGQDLAVTFGIVNAASPIHAMAKVPGQMGFCLDLRSVDTEVLESVDNDLKLQIAKIEAQRPGLRFALGSQSRSTPVGLSGLFPDLLGRAARELGQSPRTMHSGGGHDAAAFATAGWDSGLVFIRNEHGSHCPEESMTTVDLAEAVAVTAHALLNEEKVNT